MISLIQRVSEAEVIINEKQIAKINNGILALIGIEVGDNNFKINRFVNKLLNFRIFNDNSGRMNLNILQIQGEVLLVPQFTLLADNNSGNRPSFSQSPNTSFSKDIFNKIILEATKSPIRVASGEFGKEMKVNLSNEGPATFWVKV